jgi:hypothetical protein
VKVSSGSIQEGNVKTRTLQKPKSAAPAKDKRSPKLVWKGRPPAHPPFGSQIGPLVVSEGFLNQPLQIRLPSDLGLVRIVHKKIHQGLLRTLA